jgi:hypothetical protein
MMAEPGLVDSPYQFASAYRFVSAAVFGH